MHRKDYKLGRYDATQQAYEVKTAWGTVMLPVPPSDAEGVKKAWKSSVQDMTIRPMLQLSPETYRPVVSGISAIVNGKVYGVEQP